MVAQDWFDYAERTAAGPTLVVGNPPFGRNSSLAHRFIAHAFEVVDADTVAFVLPRGFTKASVQDRVYRHAKKVDELLLPTDSFTLHGNPYSLPAAFQVWQRTDEPRPLTGGRLTGPHFSWVGAREKCEVVVRRVGGRAGSAFLPGGTFSPQSNYFIRLDAGFRRGVSAKSVVELINSIDFVEARNGTGPNTLSKREFVRHFDAAVAREFGAAAELVRV